MHRHAKGKDIHMKINLLAYRCAYWNGKLYCTARNVNLIFSVDLKDGAIELVASIPEEDIRMDTSCGDIKIWHGKLIFSPNTIKKLWIYDLASKHWDSIEIDYPHWGAGTFTQIHIYQDTAFLVGASYTAIACINLRNNSCSYIETPYKEVTARYSGERFFFFYFNGARVEDTLYLASCLDNFVLKFDLATRKHEWIEVGDKENTYSEIAWDGENFWLSPRQKGGIIKWDGGTGTEILPLSKTLDDEALYVWHIIYDGKNILLSNTFQLGSIVIDKQTNHLHFSEMSYSLLCQSDSEMFLTQTSDGNLLVRTKNLSDRTFLPTIDSDQLNLFFRKEKNTPIFAPYNLYHETPEDPVLSLKGFLSYTESQPTIPSHTNIQIGKQIWEHIRDKKM